MNQKWLRRYAAGTVAVVLIFAAAGCGEGGGTAASDGAPIAANPTGSSSDSSADHAGEWDVRKMQPCRTVTATDVTKATGKATAAGVKLESWPPLCRFVLQPESTLLFVGDDPRPSGATEFEQLRNSGQKVEPVTGLGDQAYWIGEFNTLHVMVGTTHLKVIISGPGVPPAATGLQYAEALARTAIPRL